MNPPERFQETMVAFGQSPGKVHELARYAIDNESHHRGQGYGYLRSPGIDPPAFYERSAPGDTNIHGPVDWATRGAGSKGTRPAW